MIYFVAKNIGLYGGAAVVAMDVVDSMIRSNIEFRAICLQYKVPDERAEILSSMKQFKMPYVPEKGDYTATSTGKVKYHLKSAQGVFDRKILDSKIRANPPELMIFNGYRPSTMAVIKRYSSKCKTVHIVHVSPNYVDKFEDFISLDELLDVYEKADSLIFVSDECRKSWLEYDAIEEHKVHYIPNCAKEDEAKRYLSRSKGDARKRLGLNPDSFYLINVASVSLRKGQDLLIEAAPELKKIAPNLKILFVGSRGGEYVSELEAKVKEKDLNYVHFMGRKSNAMEYIYASDLFVLPSRAEAFPLVILEAMILQTPVIGSNVDGIPEMVIPDETGLLFESENSRDLVQKFELMYKNPEEREKYAENASKKYWSDFSKEQFTKRYAGLIEKLLKGE